MSTSIEAVLNNPLGISEADLERMLAAQSGEDPGEVEQEAVSDDADQGDETGGASAAGEQSPVGQPAQSSEGQQIDPSKAEVLTKDGKHSIPYTVLQRARDEAAAAQQLIQQERAKSEQLERQIAELQGRGTNDPAVASEVLAAAEGIDAEQLAALREEAPELAKLLEGLANIAKSAEQRATAAEKLAQESQQREQARTVDAQTRVVEDAIGKNAKLLWTRSEQPEVYNAIVDCDNLLRQSPQAREWDLPTRLTKAIAMYEAANGAIVVPGSAKTGTTQEPKVSSPGLRVPSTLSDMPGGSLPPRSDSEQIADLSGTDMVAMMSKMTEAEQTAFLARVAI